MESYVFKLGKIFSLEKLGWNGKLANLMLDLLFSQRTKYALTPKLLSHSPNDKWKK